ncbi:MAG: hypothetical protein KBD66_02270 [Candidatus Doudnabacteria bacterium]|nr:hypothetical protein [Candidatus Doudnabacteria bacterium]
MQYPTAEKGGSNAVLQASFLCIEGVYDSYRTKWFDLGGVPRERSIVHSFLEKYNLRETATVTDRLAFGRRGVHYPPAQACRAPQWANASLRGTGTWSHGMGEAGVASYVANLFRCSGRRCHFTHHLPCAPPAKNFWSGRLGRPKRLRELARTLGSTPDQ